MDSGKDVAAMDKSIPTFSARAGIPDAKMSNLTKCVSNRLQAGPSHSSIFLPLQLFKKKNNKFCFQLLLYLLLHEMHPLMLEMQLLMLELRLICIPWQLSLAQQRPGRVG